MTKEYEIKKITDMLDIPMDKIDDFLVDLRNWIILGKVTDRIGEGQVKTSHLIWVDDGEKNISLVVEPKTEI